MFSIEFKITYICKPFFKIKVYDILAISISFIKRVIYLLQKSIQKVMLYTMSKMKIAMCATSNLLHGCNVQI